MDIAPGGNGSGDEHEDFSISGRDKKQYHRHSAEQIQRLESFFKDCPHPDDNQRRQLSRDLRLEPRQIKFWFQNKRTQTKTQNERADNNTLKTENERFYCENLAMREALRNLVCAKCEGVPFGEEARQRNLQKLRDENAWLKREYERFSNIVSTFSRRHGTVESFVSPAYRTLSNLPEARYSGQGMGVPPFDLQHTPAGTSMNPLSSYKLPGIQEMEKSVMVEAAITAMDELIELFRVNEPLWIRSSTDGRYILHRESYDKLYPKITHVNSANAWIESSKDSGIVPMTAIHLIDIFHDPKKWMDFFPTIVTKARTIEVLHTGNRGGSLYLMHEKLHVLSPLVAPREFMFLRYIRQLDSTTWVIVHISYDCFKEQEDDASSRSWRLPSGCIIQEMPNGKANVAWVEHVEVDDKSLTHHLYKDIVCHSQAYGAKRWIVTLQRMSERFAFSMGSRATPGHELEGVIDSSEGRRNLTKLSHKMVKNFHEILIMPEKLDFPQLSELNDNGFRVSIRKRDASVQPNGMIVCVATSLWIPTSFENLFDFLKDEKARAQWDVLSDENPIQKIAHISTGTHPGNSISLLQPDHVAKNNMLILQESSIDSLGATLIYAPIELQAITSTLNGQDSTKTHVLPSGFIMSSDGGVDDGMGASTSSSLGRSIGSLLTVAFQILVYSSTISDQPNMESVTTVHALINTTIQRIKAVIGSKPE